MGITSFNNQEVVFVSFEALGLCFTVSDGKLNLIGGSDDDTPETELNRLVASLRSFIKARRFDLEKSRAINPLLSFVTKNGGMPEELSSELLQALSDNDCRCRKGITEAEILISDILDLMTQYSVPIHPEDSHEDTTNAASPREEISSLLERLRNSK